MNHSTLVEAYFDTQRPSHSLKSSAVETGLASINTLADLLANQREPLSPEQCEAVGQLFKEVGMLTFLAYEQTLKH